MPIAARTLAFLIAIVASPTVVAATYRLNDTGAVNCVVAGKDTTACDGTWTDADFGRDSNKPGDADGLAGFSFTKLDPQGAALVASAPQWSCIRDNVTGLVWENKTVDGSIHDRDQLFDNLGAAAIRPVEMLAQASSGELLCGYDDWRIATRRELWSITHAYMNPDVFIDETYFSNSFYSQYWTSTPYQRDKNNKLWTVDFNDLSATFSYGSRSFRARAVRSDGPYGLNDFAASGNEVTDRTTALIWKRCAEGQVWTGTTCRGTATRMTLQDAIAYSKAISVETGTTWRIPNFKELDSIVALDKTTQPTIDTSVFPGTRAELFWTASGIGMSLRDGRSLSSASFPLDSLGAIRLVRNLPR